MYSHNIPDSLASRDRYTEGGLPLANRYGRKLTREHGHPLMKDIERVTIRSSQLEMRV
jgi:hypothetical protein